MERILDFIAKETDGKNYKSYKYCFESVEIPKLDYEDKNGIQVKKKGETDRSLTTTKSVKALADRISKNGRPLFKYFLDGSRRTYKVVDIADNGYGSAKSSAQGLLEFAYGYDYCNCPDLPEGIELKSSNSIDLDKLAQAKGLDITVEPNPVNTWAALNYSLPLTETQAVIKITDNSGKIVKQIQIDQQQGQYVLDTRSYKSGIYYYTITCGDLQRTGKLIVQ